MHTPKVNFKYSDVYDRRAEEFFRLKKPDAAKIYPSSDEILEKINQIREYWISHGNNVLKAISKESGLKWQTDVINCYVVGITAPFSDPLTMPLKPRKQADMNIWIDVLVHELIHNILVENRWNKFEELHNLLETKYSSETNLTKTHIPVHAIHKAVYLGHFNKERLNMDIEFCKTIPDYVRAWEIVETEGAMKIINLLK